MLTRYGDTESLLSSRVDGFSYLCEVLSEFFDRVLFFRARALGEKLSSLVARTSCEKWTCGLASFDSWRDYIGNFSTELEAPDTAFEILRFIKLFWMAFVLWIELWMTDLLFGVLSERIVWGARAGETDKEGWGCFCSVFDCMYFENSPFSSSTDLSDSSDKFASVLLKTLNDQIWLTKNS